MVIEHESRNLPQARLRNGPMVPSCSVAPTASSHSLAQCFESDCSVTSSRSRGPMLKPGVDRRRAVLLRNTPTRTSQERVQLSMRCCFRQQSSSDDRVTARRAEFFEFLTILASDHDRASLVALVILAPEAPNSSAQGNALGTRPTHILKP